MKLHVLMIKLTHWAWVACGQVFLSIFVRFFKYIPDNYLKEKIYFNLPFLSLFLFTERWPTKQIRLIVIKIFLFIKSNTQW